MAAIFFAYELVDNYENSFWFVSHLKSTQKPWKSQESVSLIFHAYQPKLNCGKVLVLDPTNELIKEYEPVMVERIRQLEEDQTEEADSGNESETSEDDNDTEEESSHDESSSDEEDA